MKWLWILLAAATCAAAYGSARIDESGKWLDAAGKPVNAFGVNYSPMFAHSYRRIEQLGIDHKAAIDQDVYHFVRMGFNAYRIHVWDIEISDGEGNLIENEHLDCLDYLIFRLSEHGIAILLTPMFLGENGYPDPPTDEPGFARGHHKKEFVTDATYAAAQLVYLRQLLGHVNPYTKNKYKDEPAIIAIEPVNEPWHEGGNEAIARHLDALTATIRDTGCTKPVFYCMSQNPYLRELYYERDFDGFTFQWYPAGLSSSLKTLNLLPQVNSYPLFFGDEPGFRNAAKAFYELSLASVPTAYAYPPMAETIRDQGFQFGAYFSYDPMAIAAYNSEYPVHFMNLAYTPRHALNLMIAAEVFRGETAWSVDAQTDQSLLNNGELYYYSNGTAAPPAAVAELRRIAGFGTSPLVEYPGEGAYFLDNLEDGVWRLEVMPDAVLLVENPFWHRKDGAPVADVAWNEHAMSIDLPDLGSDFRVFRLTGNSRSEIKTETDEFMASPGVYLLEAGEAAGNWNHQTSFNGYPLAHFVAPQSNSIRKPAKAYNFKQPSPPARDTVLFDAGKEQRPVIMRSQNADRLIEQQSYQDGSFTVSIGEGRLLWGHAHAEWSVQLFHRLQAQPLRHLIVHAGSGSGQSLPVLFSFQTFDGTVFAALSEVPAKPGRIEIPLANFQPIETGRVESNPSFLPVSTGFTGPQKTLVAEDIQLFQFRLGPGLTEEQKQQAVGLILFKASLE